MRKSDNCYAAIICTPCISTDVVFYKQQYMSMRKFKTLHCCIILYRVAQKSKPLQTIKKSY